MLNTVLGYNKRLTVVENMCFTLVRSQFGSLDCPLGKRNRKSNENFESVSQSNFIRFSNFDFRLLIFDFVLPEGKFHFQNKFVAKIFIFIIIIMKVHRNITVIPPNDGECPYLKPYYLLKIEDQIKPF